MGESETLGCWYDLWDPCWPYLVTSCFAALSGTFIQNLIRFNQLGQTESKYRLPPLLLYGIQHSGRLRAG